MTSTITTNHAILEVKSVPWEELDGSYTLVQTTHLEKWGATDTGISVRFFKLQKKNDKSGWIAPCDKDGNYLGALRERVPRNKIPRKTLVSYKPKA